MAQYGNQPSLSRLRQQASNPIDVTDSFIPGVTEHLSLYGKRMHLTLYYEQKKHAYIYYLLWWTTAWIGGHLFYINRPRDGYRRLLMPYYIFVVSILGGIITVIASWIWETLGAIILVILVVVLIVLILALIISCFVELFSAVHNVSLANIEIAKGLAERISAIDDNAKKP